jgi:hypothetical protein
MAAGPIDLEMRWADRVAIIGQNDRHSGADSFAGDLYDGPPDVDKMNR